MTKILLFFILTLGIISCNSDESTPNSNENFKFTSEYSATVTVGGVVGITKRTFKVGEAYKGTDEGKETIIIRIAEHSK